MNVEQDAQELDYITPDDGTASEVEEEVSELDQDTEAEAELKDGEGDDQLEDDEAGDDEDEDNSESEDQTEEIEFSGKKYKVPKEIVPALMMQADYTRKTQEVADFRRGLEQQAAAVQRQEALIAQQTEVVKQNLKGFAQLENIDHQIAEYGKVDWDAWERQDPFAAQSAYRKLQAIRDQRQQVIGNLQKAEAEVRQKMDAQAKEQQAQEAAARAEAMRNTLQVLQKDIKGWDDKLAGEVTAYASKQGYAREELINATGDPRAFKLLHKAMQYDRLIAKQKAAAKAAKQEQAKPLTKVSGRSAAPVTGLDDRLSAEEWVKRRNEQMRSR